MNDSNNQLIKIDVTTVSWFNKNEWMEVFNFLYSETPRRRKAMEILKMWKMKHPRLPAGIEGTYILLQVLDKPSQNIEEYDLKILYSTAIMRFLNVCVTHDTVQGRFSKYIKYFKIPRWVVDIRHEIAHGINLPSLDILQKACNFGYYWLYDQYWHPVSKLLCDYVFETNTMSINNDKEISSDNEEKLLFLLEIFECIVLFQHPKFHIQTINDIPDLECKQNLLEDLKNFKSLLNVTINTSLSSLSELVIYAFNGYISMASTDIKKQIVDTLLNGIGFLCEQDLQLKLFESTSLEILPWSYVLLWLELLQVFSKCSILEYLIIKLFNIMSNQDENDYKKRMASLWVIEIAKALKKVQLCQIVHERNLNDMNENIKSNRQEYAMYIITKTESVHPTLKQIMTFDPFTKIPSIFTDFKKFSKVALYEPNEYIKLCLPFILELTTPKLNSNLITQLHQLIEKFTDPVEITNEEKSDESVYSVNDLKKYVGNKIFKHEGEENDSEIMDSEDNNNRSSVIENTPMKNDSTNENEYNDDNNHWRMASEHLNFHNCPLGLLPWQDTSKNPVLQTFLES